MAYPTGTFSSPYAGRIIVGFSGKFSSSSYHDAGFPSSGNTNLAIRGYVGPVGSYSYTPVLDRYSLFAEIELNYPGGSVVWNLGMELVATLLSGISYATFSELKIGYKFIKK